MKDGDCFCFRCRKWFHHLGIASHRAMHRRMSEDCTIEYSDGHILTHRFGPEKEWVKCGQTIG